MALYAFDGTWNSAKTDDENAPKNTNVFRFYQAYHRHSNTNDLYVPGVGTRWDKIGRIVGGLFGVGELPRIDEAYEHLCKAWAANDHVIDIVGFSRGAATTLDFCYEVQKRGIRLPDSHTVVEPNPQIRFLGVWDIVAAFGIANLGNTAANLGHHLSIPKSNLKHCFHALALDERRPSFLPTRLHGAQEVWFRGVHSDVGGGNGNRGLNDIALKWMMCKAKAAHLPILDADIAALAPVPGTEPHTDKPPLKVRAISPVDRRHYTVTPMGDWATPPDTCVVETRADEQVAPEVSAPVEVLPLEVRRHVEQMWATAEAAAKDGEVAIGEATDPLIALFQSRAVLLATDDDLRKAGRSVVQLIAAMIKIAHRHGFNELHEVELNEALFNLHPLFPFTE